MALATNVQVVGGATSSAAPASVSPTWTATGAGNTLLLFLGVASSGAPAVTTPAGWTLITSSVQGANVALYAFVLPGNANAGGGTGVTITLTNVNGAAWIFYELVGAVGGTPIDGSSIVRNTNVSNTAVSVQPFARVNNAVREFGAVARLSGGGAFTSTGGGGQAAWTADVAAQTSSAGVTNVILSVLSLQQGAAPRLDALFSGTLAVAAAWASIEVQLLSTSSGAFGYGPDGAVPDITQGYAVAGKQ